tara:strand:+ start:6872 stop:6991 length:120 start_codon:yes stop_codon:yes gene_type:complete
MNFIDHISIDTKSTNKMQDFFNEFQEVKGTVSQRFRSKA